MMHIYEMVAIFFYFFIMADTDILFPIPFQIPHHHTTLSLVQFQHLSMMMFLHLNIYAWTFTHDNLSALPKGT